MFTKIMAPIDRCRLTWINLRASGSPSSCPVQRERGGSRMFGCLKGSEYTSGRQLAR